MAIICISWTKYLLYSKKKEKKKSGRSTVMRNTMWRSSQSRVSTSPLFTQTFNGWSENKSAGTMFPAQFFRDASSAPGQHVFNITAQLSSAQLTTTQSLEINWTFWFSFHPFYWPDLIKPQVACSWDLIDGACYTCCSDVWSLLCCVFLGRSEPSDGFNTMITGYFIVSRRCWFCLWWIWPPEFRCVLMWCLDVMNCCVCETMFGFLRLYWSLTFP